MTFNQAEYDIRCEWGENGVAALASDCNALIIIDILSFTTCVEVATARGVTVYPYRWKDSSSQRVASEIDPDITSLRREIRELQESVEKRLAQILTAKQMQKYLDIQKEERRKVRSKKRRRSAF